MKSLKGFLILLVVAVPALSSIGCAAIKHELDSLSDDQLATYLEKGAQYTAKYGISMASKKWPTQAAKIKADAIILDNAIRNVVLPIFSGASTSQVTQAVLQQVLQDLGNKVKGTTVDALELAFSTVLFQVPLPTNPASALSSRTLKAITGFFTGIAEGIEQAEGLPSPTPAPAPPPTPVPAPPPPAPVPPNKP